MRMLWRVRGAAVNVTPSMVAGEKNVSFVSMLAATFHKLLLRVPWKTKHSTPQFLSEQSIKTSSINYLCTGTYNGVWDWQLKKLLVGEIIPADIDVKTSMAPKVIHYKAVMVTSLNGNVKRNTWNIGDHCAIISESYE